MSAAAHAAGAIALRVEPSVVPVGEKIVLSYRVPVEMYREGDWVGLFRTDQNRSHRYIMSRYARPAYRNHGESPPTREIAGGR